jgi:flagellar protein FlbD
MNAEKIRYVEQTPDTVVCSDTGEKLMVKETLEEVMRRAIDYARAIRRPITE